MNQHIESAQSTFNRIFDAFPIAARQEEYLHYLREVVDDNPVLSRIVISKIVDIDKKKNLTPQFVVSKENEVLARAQLNGTYESSIDLPDGMVLISIRMRS